jgi:hypothetical protein
MVLKRRRSSIGFLRDNCSSTIDIEQCRFMNQHALCTIYFAPIYRATERALGEERGLNKTGNAQYGETVLYQLW